MIGFRTVSRVLSVHRTHAFPFCLIGLSLLFCVNTFSGQRLSVGASTHASQGAEKKVLAAEKLSGCSEKLIRSLRLSGVWSSVFWRVSARAEIRAEYLEASGRGDPNTAAL